jgi:GGDEF domain-containing protein
MGLWKLTSQIITTACYKANLIARIGGDEFVIIYLKADLSQLANIWDRIQLASGRQYKTATF